MTCFQNNSAQFEAIHDPPYRAHSATRPLKLPPHLQRKVPLRRSPAVKWKHGRGLPVSVQLLRADPYAPPPQTSFVSKGNSKTVSVDVRDHA